MITWIAIVGVGLVSYVFRALPVVVLGRLDVPESVDRTLRHAGTAALAALLVSAVRHGAASPWPVPATAAAAASLLVAFRGRTMPVVVLVGAATYLASLAVTWLV